MRSYFMETARIGFSNWNSWDLALARQLWGDPQVVRLIARDGFSQDAIIKRLAVELHNERTAGVQYWPIFDRHTHELLGCCGLRPFAGQDYEIGFHLRPSYWGQGLAYEAAKAVTAYAFKTLGVKTIIAGHHPENVASGSILRKLGFAYIGEHYYEPTQLQHPSYRLCQRDFYKQEV